MSHVSRFLEPTLIEHLNQMRIGASSVVQGGTVGLHRSPVRGASVEFRQHRFYVPGDEPRRLDWRVLARTDRPFVKEYDEETNLRCTLLLDGSGSMGYAGRDAPASKFDYSAQLVAALAYVMLGQTESVGLGVCGEGLRDWVAPRAGPTQLSRLLEELERSSPAGGSGMDKAMHEVAERIERRGLVIVVSDFFAPIEPLRAGLAHLRHRRHEVVAVQVSDRDEEDFPFRRWTRFRGKEGEATRLVEPATVRKDYQDNLKRHRRMLKEACLALRVDLLHFTTDKSMLEAIRAFVGRR